MLFFGVGWQQERIKLKLDKNNLDLSFVPLEDGQASRDLQLFLLFYVHCLGKDDFNSIQYDIDIGALFGQIRILCFIKYYISEFLGTVDL